MVQVVVDAYFFELIKKPKEPAKGVLHFAIIHILPYSTFAHLFEHFGEDVFPADACAGAVDADLVGAGF